MSLGPQPTSLLHPSQVLTVSQAAGWIQHLIDSYIPNVWTLQTFSLDEAAFREYSSPWDRLIAHAGVLEQLMCRLCFFLRERDVRVIVAIIVVTHYQLGLLKAPDGTDERFVLDGQTVAAMADFLAGALAKLSATHEWVQTAEYAQFQIVVSDALSRMRDSHSLYLQSLGGLSAPSTSSGSSQHPSSDHVDMEYLPAPLATFLDCIAPRYSSFPLSDVQDADWRVLCQNMQPLIFERPPYLDPGIYACSPSEDTQARSSSAGSSTAWSGRDRKGKGKAKAVDFQDTPTTSKKRRRDTEVDREARQKRHRITVVCHGIVEDHTVVEQALVRPFIGRAVPLAPDPPPPHLQILPSPCSSASSISTALPAFPSPTPLRKDLDEDDEEAASEPSVVYSMDDSHHYEDHGASVSDSGATFGTYQDEDDGASVSDGGAVVDVEMADTLCPPRSAPPTPASKRRHCWQGLLYVLRFFSGRV